MVHTELSLPVPLTGSGYSSADAPQKLFDDTAPIRKPECSSFGLSRCSTERRTHSDRQCVQPGREAARRRASAPHAPHAGADIEARPCLGGGAPAVPRGRRPSRAVEQAEQLFRNEPRPSRRRHGDRPARLAMGEEALRHDQVEIVLGAGHGDIEQAPLLLDLGRGACARDRKACSRRRR